MKKIAFAIALLFCTTSHSGTLVPTATIGGVSLGNPATLHDSQLLEFIFAESPTTKTRNFFAELLGVDPTDAEEITTTFTPIAEPMPEPGSGLLALGLFATVLSHR